MLSGTTPSAWAMVGTAVLRMVVSSDSMKNARATNHGKRRLALSRETIAGADVVESAPFIQAFKTNSRPSKGKLGYLKSQMKQHRIAP